MMKMKLKLDPAADNKRKETNDCKSGLACKYCDKSQQYQCWKKEKESEKNEYN